MIIFLPKLTCQSMVKTDNSFWGSRWGSVGKAVASDTRGLRFESHHCQSFIEHFNYQVYWKDENKEKRGRQWPIKKSSSPGKILRSGSSAQAANTLSYFFLSKVFPKTTLYWKERKNHLTPPPSLCYNCWLFSLSLFCYRSNEISSNKQQGIKHRTTPLQVVKFYVHHMTARTTKAQYNCCNSCWTKWVCNWIIRRSLWSEVFFK